MRGSWLVACLLAVLGAAAPACRRSPAPAPASAVTGQYYCPMHPSYVSDKPGNCPICGMRLVRAGSPEAGSGASDAAPVPGRVAVTLSPQKRHLLGIRTEPVRRGRIARVIRTVGRVAVDERRVHHVHTKYDGYVEHLHVDFVGKYVERGERLLSIFSPELVATQEEYLLAYRAQARLAQSGIPAVAKGGADLLEASRQRLLFWDVRPEDIRRIEQTGQVQRALQVHSEISGYVVQKMAFHGMRVTPADTLFDIVDLSHLWVLADAYESDLPSIRLGMQASLGLPYLAGRTWSGTVTNIAPTVDEKTRTVKVRVEVDNHENVLKPDMFADVRLEADLGEGLTVPESAVIPAGDRSIVFVETAEDRIEPREVRLGARAGEAFQVLTGLAEGERVVTPANFLLDSEASLRSALAAMRPDATAPSQSPGPGAPAHRH